MRILIFVWFLCPLAALAADLQAVEVPPHFDFHDHKARVCGDCGAVREIDIHDRFDERPRKSFLVGTVVGAPSERVDRGIYYRVTIDMDDGKTREVNVKNGAGLGIGTRVRLVDGNIEPTG